MNRNMDCSDREWSARQELAACYRIFDHNGWAETIYNHITLRVPGEANAFLINPYGLMWSEVCASNLVKIDIDGNKLDNSPHPVNPAGFLQHSLFHRHLDWAHAICHTHTVPVMAVCSVEGGLQTSNFYGSAFAGRLAWHEFEGVTIRPEESERLLADLGDKRIMMLRHHGPVVLGETLGEMYTNYWMLQRACEVQVQTMAMGTPLVVPDDVVAVHQRDLLNAGVPGGIGVADLQAWQRKLDAMDRTWRD